jgi:hypothetical protein
MLRRHVRDHKKTRWQDHCVGLGWSRGVSESHVEDLVSILKNEVASHKTKNVDILFLASQITAHLNGML